MSAAALRDSLSRASAVLGVAAAMAIVGGLATYAIVPSPLFAPHHLVLPSCVTWIVLAPLLRRRTAASTVLIGVLSTVVGGAAVLLLHAGPAAEIPLRSARDFAGAMAYVLGYILGTAPVTLPVGIATAFLMRAVVTRGWRGLRPRRHRIGALLLGLALASPLPAPASERIALDGSTGMIPLVAALARAYQERHPGVTVEIGKGLGTKARLEALAQGRIDVALASHGLVAEELARRRMVAHEIARVAVVFGVHASVLTANVTHRQLCEVYAATLTNWQQLGGPDLPIAPRTRPDSEVDAEVVRAKIGCMTHLKMPAGVKTMASAADMARELAGTAGAIGMTTTTVVAQSRGRIRFLSLDGVVPSADNVERKIYTLTRDSFLVTTAPAPAAVAGFLDFIRSPGGADIILANGAVPAR